MFDELNRRTIAIPLAALAATIGIGGTALAAGSHSTAPSAQIKAAHSPTDVPTAGDKADNATDVPTAGDKADNATDVPTAGDKADNATDVPTAGDKADSDHSSEARRRRRPRRPRRRGVLAALARDPNHPSECQAHHRPGIRPRVQVSRRYGSRGG